MSFPLTDRPVESQNQCWIAAKRLQFCSCEVCFHLEALILGKASGLLTFRFRRCGRIFGIYWRHLERKHLYSSVYIMSWKEGGQQQRNVRVWHKANNPRMLSQDTKFLAWIWTNPRVGQRRAPFIKRRKIIFLTCYPNWKAVGTCHGPSQGVFVCVVVVLLFWNKCSHSDP